MRKALGKEEYRLVVRARLPIPIDGKSQMEFYGETFWCQNDDDAIRIAAISETDTTISTTNLWLNRLERRVVHKEDGTETWVTV